MTQITIGKNVKTIGKNAFTGCKNLKKIIVKTKLLTKKGVKAKAFSGVKASVTIKVPGGKKKAYTTLFRKKGLSRKATVK